MKLEWWNVTMEWDDEGTMSESFFAADGEAAQRMCAEVMADRSGIEFESEADRARYIEARMKGASDVYRTADQFQQDFMRLFGDALFGDGPRCEIDLEKLAEVLVAHRDVIMVSRPDAQRPRG